MIGRSAGLDAEDIDEPDGMAILSPSELRLLVRDYEDLVDAGLLDGTPHETAQFASGWLAFGDQHGRPLPDSLRLIVLPGFGKGNA